MENYLFLCLIYIILGINSDVSGKKPKLFPEDNEIVIKDGGLLHLNCSIDDNSMLHFSFPKSTFMSPRCPHELKGTGNGSLSFYRKKVSSVDTGWYACATADVQIENNFKILNHTHEEIAWIYVYVKSTDKYADQYYTFPKTLIVPAGHRGIVPCRITSPGYKVELWRNFERVEPDEEKSFDPKIGFTVDSPSSGDFEMIFSCYLDGYKDVYILLFSSTSARRPRMNPATDELSLREGDELRIECHGEMKIRFTFPESSGTKREYLFEKKPTEHEILSDGKGKTTFIRRMVSLGDAGWYGCFEDGLDASIQPHFIDYTEEEINWIYVNVISDTAGGRRHEVQDINDILFNEFMTLITPCHPIRPSFKITLEVQTVGGSKVIPRNLDLTQVVRYDPKLGFVIKHHRYNNRICYICHYTEDNSERIVYRTCYKDAPTENKYSITEGQNLLLTGEELRFSCEANVADIFIIKWNIPVTVSKNRTKYSLRRWQTGFHSIDPVVRKTLTVTNVTEDDSGIYVCMIVNLQTKSKIIPTQIFDRNNLDYIIINDSSSTFRFEKLQGQNVTWMVDYVVRDTYVSTSMKWYTPLNDVIDHKTETTKYETWDTIYHRSVLKINNLTFDDIGNYKLLYNVTEKNLRNRTITITLDVQAPPTIFIEDGSKSFYSAPGGVFHTLCNTIGNPRPNITWSFDIDPNFSFNNDSSLNNHMNHEHLPGFSEYIWLSKLNMTINIPGILTCTACNALNCSSTNKRIFVSDGIERFGIISPKVLPFFGDDVNLTCAGLNYIFKNLSWDDQFHKCYENISRKIFYIEDLPTKYTMQKVLHMRNLTECNQRTYSCLGLTINNDINNSSYLLQLRVPRKPYFTSTNLHGTKMTFYSGSVDNTTQTLTCLADGDPPPDVTWFQENVQLQEGPVYNFSRLNRDLIINLNKLEKKNTRYTCKAENRFGTITDYVDIVLEAEGSLIENMKIVIITLLLISLVVLIVWLVIRKHRRKVARRKFIEGILNRSNKGALDPNLDIFDQTDALPYDAKFEYPRELLTLDTHLWQFVDKVLGSGAFGIVRKAEAKSIRAGQRSTTVAVKMVRATFRLHHMMALTRELKVLIYLGEHLNIVNLLGACTKDIDYGELFVIVEFCRFGNLHDYLFRHRGDFIDEIDPVTDADVESNIGPDAGSNIHSGASANMDCDAESDTSISDRNEDSTSAGDGVSETLPAELGLRSKYDGDCTDASMGPLRTKDLLSWAWQVSRGMRYLGSRKIVHGDLAARNILLADKNVIKICDFGLARALYTDDHYKDEGQGPLPLKWMAIESIKERSFSIQSDVWSFGIVLWEFFALAETPYPGIHPKFVYQKLVQGYRMDRPKNAPKGIYRMMMNCWDAEPAKRPSFAQIEKDIGELLDDSTKTYYVDLSSQYTEIHPETLETEEVDDFTMSSSRSNAASFSVGLDKVELINATSSDSS